MEYIRQVNLKKGGVFECTFKNGKKTGNKVVADFYMMMKVVVDTTL